MVTPNRREFELRSARIFAATIGHVRFCGSILVSQAILKHLVSGYGISMLDLRGLKLGTMRSQVLAMIVSRSSMV